MDQGTNRRHAVINSPPLPTPIDYEIRSLGGTTTAFDTMSNEVQVAKKPVLMQDRIVELSREVGRLRQEIKYYKTLVNEVLHPLIAVVSFHTNQLDSAVREFNEKIERANLRWQAEKVE